jgi:hypothetical protein
VGKDRFGLPAMPAFKKSSKYWVIAYTLHAKAAAWEIIKTKARLPKYNGAVAPIAATCVCHQTNESASN